MFDHRITTALEERRNKGLTRSLIVLEDGNQINVKQGNRAYIHFSSNDYMGLANCSELAKRWQEGIDLYGVGSGSSPLVTGFSRAHSELEETLCDWLGYSRAILFSSGFAANQAVLFSLLNKSDRLIQDKLNHASLMEAGLLTPATMKRFKHNDVDHLRTILTPIPHTNTLPTMGQSLVVTEGVFSMDGDIAPLAKIAKATHDNNGWLMVDDAHGIGVLGKNGAGSSQLAGVKPQLLVVTFGKAFGLSGAAVLCNQNVGDYLTQFAKHHVYSTAIPPSQAYALTHAAMMLQSQQWRRDSLAHLQDVYNSQLRHVTGFVQTDTPIKPFICGSVAKTMQLVNTLKDAGFWVTGIRPPTVPKNSSRVRITLTANHTPEQVKQLTDVILACTQHWE